jgi:hypothetical protein
MNWQGLLPPGPRDEGRAAAREVQGRVARWWARWRPAWLTGADLRILNQVSSEWSFYDTLGVGVFGLSCFSGLSATLALGYVLRTPALHLWWFGALWTVGLLFCVERIVLQVPTTRKRSTFYASLLYRGALSLVIAAFLAEPMTLRLNEPEINAQLHQEHREDKEAAEAKIADHFEPLIAQARNELHDTRARKIELQREVAEFRRRHGEAVETGCGADCVFFAQTATAKESRLRAVEERNEHRQPELHKKLRELSQSFREAKNGEGSAVEKDDGFWARLGALSAVMDQHSMMNLELWGLRIGFLLFDMAPLLALIFYLKRDGPKPYEELRVAYWHLDAIAAQEIKGNAEVREHEIWERTKTEKEIVQAEIMLQADRRIAEAGLDGVIGERDGSPSEPSAPASRRNLADLLRNVRFHENEPVSVSPELRRGGLLGSAAIGITAMLATLWSVVSGHAAAGLWIAVGLLCGVAVLAFSTHGFRRAPAWALWAIFAVLILGLIAPLALFIANV